MYIVVEIRRLDAPPAALFKTNGALMHVHVDGNIPGVVLGESLAGCHYIEIFDFLLRFSKTVKTTNISKLNGMMALHPDCADQIRLVMGEILRKKDV